MNATLAKTILVLSLLIYSCFASPTGIAKEMLADSPDIANLIVVEPKVLDFGQINSELQDKIELLFTIKNLSKNDISNVNARAGCGCTTTKLPQSILKAGSTVSVPVIVNISGRRGEFENDVKIEIDGHKEPLIVPIRGKIIQNIWFEKAVISCSVNDSETSVEREFEIHTVDYPDVQVRLDLHEKALSIKEQSRIKNEDRTIIKFLLKISDIPFDRTTNNYRLVLTPTDRKIQPLVIPVICYRPLRQIYTNDALTSSVQTEDVPKPTLSPERVSLGVLRSGSIKQFSISSNTPNLLTSIKIAEVKGFPEYVKVEMATEISTDNTRTVSVYVNEPAVSGMTEGVIELVTADGQTHSIVVVGIVVATPSKKQAL